MLYAFYSKTYQGYQIKNWKEFDIELLTGGIHTSFLKPDLMKYSILKKTNCNRLKTIKKSLILLYNLTLLQSMQPPKNIIHNKILIITTMTRNLKIIQLLVSFGICLYIGSFT